MVSTRLSQGCSLHPAFPSGQLLSPIFALVGTVVSHNFMMANPQLGSLQCHDVTACPFAPSQSCRPMLRPQTCAGDDLAMDPDSQQPLMPEVLS